MVNQVFAVIAFLGCLGGSWCEPPKMKTIYSWSSLDFAFPTEQARKLAIDQGTFKPGASVPIDVDVYYGGKEGSVVFVTIPRLQHGVPVTFGYVTNGVTSEGNPIIAPYPSWTWNNLGNCDGLTSVFRVAIDECNRLWVLDTGKVGDRQVCRPKLHVFSLINNRLIHQYKFPREQFSDTSIFVTAAVDIRNVDDKCRDTFVYIADVSGFAMLVYDYRNDRSWKIINNLLYPYPPHGTFNIKGDTFDLMDGIIGLALGPLSATGDRILYFHSLASKVESWVPTSIIRNYTLFQHNAEAAGRSFVPFKLERSSQSAAQVMNRDGVLFFGLLSDLAIACWNSKNYPEYGGTNIEKLLIDPETLQFPSGIKLVVSKSGKEELWVLTSSFQKFMTGTLKSTETNFRIQAGFVEELVRGTKCDTKSISRALRPPTLIK